MEGKTIKVGIGGMLLVAALLIGAFFVATNNNLVKMRNQVDAYAADLDVAYQRRLDYVGQLISIVEGSSIREEQILTNIVEARSKALSAPTDENAQANLQAAQSQLLAVAESYPTLTSGTQWTQMVDAIEGNENRIQSARSDYNEAVLYYNNLVQTFPSSIVARLFGYEKVEFFKAQEGAQNAPDISFSWSTNND